MKKSLFLIAFLFFASFFSNSLFAQVIVDEDDQVRLLGSYFQLSEQEEQEYLKSVSDYLRQFLEEIKKGDKNKYHEALREYYFNSAHVNALFNFTDKKDMERAKKISELNIITEALAIRYKKAGSNDKTKIKNELKQKLTELFDLREAEKKAEVESLDKKIQELRSKLSQRSANKDKIIDDRMSELVGEKKYLDWND